MQKTLLSCFICLITFVAIGQKNPQKLALNWKTDTTKRAVPLSEFTALMLPDGIPPIDQPKFWLKEEGDKVFFAHEPVISIEINGEAKAYPLSILMYHEIVNDQVGGVPIAATYCPLCNAAIVFDQRLNVKGKDYLFDFGVSGMLRHSDMVMYDRQTETWWQQFTGEALVGELTGATLEILPSMLISYEEFFATYPEGWVLSTETGKDFAYGENPYVDYDNLNNKQPRLFKEEVDERLPAMERVININAGGYDRIYPLSTIQKAGVINDNPHDVPIVIFHQKGVVSVLDNGDIKKAKDIGAVTVFSRRYKGKILSFKKVSDNYFRDDLTGSMWTISGKCIRGIMKGRELTPMIHGNHFAFAWFAFKPHCEIYGQD